MSLAKTKTVTETYTVSALLEQIQAGLLLDNHPLQRHADQHKKAYKDAFISTVIKNEDFDSIKVCEQKSGSNVILWLIDGLQRVSEIQDFRNGILKLGYDIELSVVEYRVTKTDENGEIIKDENGMPEYEIKECELKGKVFNDLPKELQNQFDLCKIDVVKHLDCTDQEIAYHIRRYNKEVPLNSSQNAMTYADRFAPQIQNIAKNKFFLDCGHYTENERNKNKINGIIMESIMSTFHLQDWKKGANLMGKYVNDNVSEKEVKMMGEYFTRLYSIAEGKYPNIFNSKNTFLFMPVFHAFTNFGRPDSDFGLFLDDFEESLHEKEIDGVSFDILSECRSTKDKSKITQKVEFLKKLLYGYFRYDSQKGFVTQIPGETIEEFIANRIGVSIQDVTEDMDFYMSCLNDAMDRTIPFNSKLREPDNLFSLLAAVAYSIIHDIDIEAWLEWYATDHEDYLIDQSRNFELIVDSFNHFTERKIA